MKDLYTLKQQKQELESLHEDLSQLLRKELAASHNSSFGSTPKEERLGRQIDKVKKKLKKVNSELSKLIVPSAFEDKEGKMIMSGDILFHPDDWNSVCIMIYNKEKDDFTLDVYGETLELGFMKLQFLDSQSIDPLTITECTVVGNVSDILRFNKNPKLTWPMIEKTECILLRKDTCPAITI